MTIDDKSKQTFIDSILNREFVSVFLVRLNENYLDFIYRNKGSGFPDIPGGVYTDIIKEYITRVSIEFHADWNGLADIEYTKRLLKDKDQYELIYVLNGVDQRWRRCSIHVTQRDESGDVSEFMMTYMTLDENRAHSLQLTQQLLEKETALKDQKAHSGRLNRVISSLSGTYDYIGYIEKDTNEIIRYYCSQLMQEIIDQPIYFGMVRNEKFDKVLENHVSEEQYATLMPEIIVKVRQLKANEIKKYSTTFEAEVNGRTHYYKLRMASDHENEGNIIFGIQNIDTEKEKEMELKKAMIEAEASNRAKTLFLNNMSHDIRTPMNAIIGFNGIAMRNVGLDNKKVISCLNKISKASDFLLNLINDILEMSRIESGNIVLAEMPGDVMLSFANTQPIMEELAKSADINLSFEFGDIQDRYVFCDFTHANRIFTNLVSNAVKYTKPGGWVKVRCEQIGKEDDHGIYQYTVEDNGIGMSEEFLAKVFERFARENNFTVSKIQGTGIGLALCKAIVDIMHGTISVESKKNVGSKFTVTLPFMIQQGKEYTDPVSNLIIDLEHNFLGKHILLVEDNEMNREIAKDILEENGFIVTCATDGLQALNRVKTFGPKYFDLVLMDIQMPIMDGYECTQKIREFLGDYHLPIIALSANAFEEDRQKSIAAGMDDHVAKPIDIKHLREILKKFLIKNKE